MWLVRSLVDRFLGLLECISSSILFLVFSLMSMDILVSSTILPNNRNKASHTSCHSQSQRFSKIHHLQRNTLPSLQCGTCHYRPSRLNMVSGSVDSSSAIATLGVASVDNGYDVAVSTFTSSNYVPPEVTPEIYVGSAVAMIPIVWATYEFTSRLRIQRNCLVCNGSG